MGTRYTREGLAGAVAGARRVSEVITALGGEVTDGSRAYAWRLIRAWGIDATHLEREGMRHTEERLRKAVAASVSINETVRCLGIDPVGGNQAHIGRRIARLGIPTTHFTVSGRRSRRSAGRDLLVLDSPDRGRRPPGRLRTALLAAGVPEECGMCGVGPVWCGKALRLEVDHVSGDWWDNRPENLRLLCPNCHATTDTYRGRKRAAVAR